MQVQHLIGAALDRTVAQCADLPFPVVFDEDGREVTVTPSTDWAQGGPIIEREKIAIKENGYGHWFAKAGVGKWMRGPTPLVAAMRCFVASKLLDNDLKS